MKDILRLDFETKSPINLTTRGGYVYAQHPDTDALMASYQFGDGWLYDRSLERSWNGFVWMNPPFGGRNGLVPWMDKFFAHGNGVALTPDRTSAPWWQAAARRADAVLFVSGKIRFIKPDGTVGKHPGTGTTLFAVGQKGIDALTHAGAAGLGWLAVRA